MIKQFSSCVSSGFSVKEPGSDGVRVEVMRSIMADGEEMEVESVSTDFYPPVHRVEVYPLTATVVETTPGEGITNSDGSTTNPDGTIANPDGTTTTLKVPSTDGSGSSTDNGNSTDQNPSNKDNTDNDNNDSNGDNDNNTGNNNDDSTNNDNKNDTGNSDGTKKPANPEYDKGGKLVNP